MGAYSDNRWSAQKAWKQVVKKKQKLILCPQYREALYDECIMAVVYGHTAPLLEKILMYSLPFEYESVMDLFTSNVDISFCNGNIIISN